MNPSCRRLSSRFRAFSLIELLTVIAILAVVVIFAIPAFTQISRSSNLSTAGQILVDTLTLARQAAITHNRRVEVRFYKVPEPSGSTEVAWRAMQLFLVKPAEPGQPVGTHSLQPLTRTLYFPNPIVLDDNPATTSTVLNPSNPSDSTPWDVPGVGSGATSKSFYFTPTGETDLDATKDWFATLIVSTDRIVNNGLPANFLTARVDGASGKVTVFRP
ncbi:MAG: Verru_Chthon cassette protein D [Terrimicrobiaceae bacterium]|nr:Verru_Chthon cassette protein D [Terrimicrobiaceae bacterium]